MAAPIQPHHTVHTGLHLPSYSQWTSNLTTNQYSLDEMQDHIRPIGNGVGSLFAGGGTERRLKPHHHHHQQQGCFKCPRCGSVNTKFCYYNNYNLSQPRFFCKGCRRYWTEGGVLRNVPVGGGTRKTKRSKRKSGDGKAPSVSSSRNSSSEDGSNIVAATISPETTTSEAAPPLLNQCSTDNHQLVSYSSDDQLRFISGPEISPSMVQQDGDRIVEKQKWGEFEWSMSCNGGAAAEDWGLFDESYWLNNPDNQLS